MTNLTLRSLVHDAFDLGTLYNIIHIASKQNQKTYMNQIISPVPIFFLFFYSRRETKNILLFFMIPFTLIASETSGSVNHRHEFRARFFPQSTRLQTAPVTGNMSPSLVKPIRTLNTSFLRTCELMVTRAETATASRAVVNYHNSPSTAPTHSSLYPLKTPPLFLL